MSQDPRYDVLFEPVQIGHIGEAVQLRCLDRGSHP